MRLLVLPALLTCGHAGLVRQEASQRFVRIGGAPVLVRPDPERVDIATCPIPVATGTKPCKTTLRLQEGYSRFVFVSGIPVCCEDARGRTDGLPAGAVDYHVVSPGQDWVVEVR